MTVSAPPEAPRRRPPAAPTHPNADAGRPGVVGFAVAAGLAVTLGMWLRHGQAGAASGPGGFATALGQLCALAGTYAVLVQLLLMSRLPWLERAIGLDRLAIWHRWNGFAAVWLLAGHVVFTTLGWAQGSIPPVSLVHETGWLISHAPDVLMAWAGFALFIAVAVTSVRAARKNLKRETWYFIHLYAYLAVALSFAHQLAVGSDFDNDRAARVWWVGLYLVVFGSLLWWRVVEPVVRNRRHKLRVSGTQVEAPGVTSIYLTGRNVAALNARPGQFFIWRFLTSDGWWRPHPFSLSAAPHGDRLRITVKNLGDDTARLQHVRRGTPVFAEGPYGAFTMDRRTRRKALLIAGGIGITPLRAMLDTIHQGDDVIMLYRVARPEDAAFADELQALSRKRGIRLHVIPGDKVGDDKTDMLSIPALRKGVPDIAERDCFVCGPPPMLAALQRRLRALNVPKAQVHFERFEL